MKAIASLDGLKPVNGDQEVGINIIRQAIKRLLAKLLSTLVTKVRSLWRAKR